MSLPLALCEVLEEEYAALHGALPDTPSWRLTPEQIVNPERLATRLAADDALARYLRAHGVDAGVLGRPDPSALAEGLNAALARGHLYDKARFAQLTLPATLTRLALLPAEGEERFHVNRVLLEAAFPGDITPIYDARTRAVYRLIHRRASRDKDPAPRTALCFSGGGIRSATFGLGVVQALAHLRLLDKFDYLSTVSGGGYLGGWLSAWVHRHRQGVVGVMHDVTAPSPKPPLRPEAASVHHLRQYSNYLSPKLGALSADTWTLVAIYVRNLLLNWTVLVPIFLAALAVPRVGVSVLEARPSHDAVRLAILLLGYASLILSVVYIGVARPSAVGERQRRPLAHLSGQVSFLLLCLTPLVLSAMLLTAWWAWSGWPTNLGLYLVTGGVLHTIAFVIYGLWMRRLHRLDEAAVALSTGVVAGALVWAAASAVVRFVPPEYLAQFLVCFAVPLFLTAFLLATTLFVGLVSGVTTEDDREWLARFGGWVLIVVVGWAVVGALVIFGPLLLAKMSARGRAAVGTLGALTSVGSALFGRSPATPAQGGEAQPRGIKAVLLKHAPVLVALLMLVLLVVGLSVLTNVLVHALSEGLRTVGALRGFAVAMPASVWDHHEVVARTTVVVSVVFMVLALAVGLGMSMVVDVNKFSLHAMYRNRLIRAYLAASRYDREPNPFTGFDPDDDVSVAELRRGLLHVDALGDASGFVETLAHPGDERTRALVGQLSPATRHAIQHRATSRAASSQLRRDLVSDLNRLLLDGWFARERAFTEAARPEARTAIEKATGGDAAICANRMLLHEAYPTAVSPPPGAAHALLHVVNVTLNLVAGHNLAWQERKAETCTVSPLHSGSYHLGYRRSRTYGGAPHGISLGTAVAISGAAASPNMGYHSSRVLAFVMTFLNARLGWWLGNPGVYGQRTYEQAFPRPSVKPLLAETFALTDDTNKHVYLSDGGHFENLGLLEMVLRRCHLIVISDASADPACSFESLANAIRKVRIDLGVPIAIRGQMRIVSRTAARGAQPGRYCAIADIHYREVDGPDAVNGTLLYVKPCFYGDEPTDVFNYASVHHEFPHESTADQFFTESQFESYRMLGFHSIRSIWQPEFAPIDPDLLDELPSRAETYLGGDPPIQQTQ